MIDQDSDRYFKAGMSALAGGDILPAIEFLSDCVRLDPTHINGRYNLAIALSLTDECDEATAHLEAIREICPGYPGIYTLMGQAAFGSYLSHKQEADSKANAMINFLMMAVEQDPDDIDAYFSLGNAYIALDVPDKAMPWLHSAMRLHPDSAAIHFTMAKALSMMDKRREAAEMADRACSLSDPSDPFWEEICELRDELLPSEY
jgi:tetratricopeptide (TPR) repeat protein